ncbi:MAG TPA: hypothetical protein VI685_21690, partial [Candidatus Angelobacter sp.]
LVLPLSLRAQTNCDAGAGPLKPERPNGIAVEEIIKKLSVQEKLFQEEQTHYTYTMEVSVQTLEGQTADGEFRRVSQISYNQGRRLENVTFAPQSTLTRISMTKEDFDDIDHRSPFVLTPEELPQYDVMYVGQQKVDQLETYVLDVAPKHMEKGRRYFQGKVWVETSGLAVVKSCGKNVPEQVEPVKKKKHRPVQENVSPTFVTYREQFEDKYWFPTYVRADETLHVLYGDNCHVREVIKYTKYKRADSNASTISNASPK